MDTEVAQESVSATEPKEQIKNIKNEIDQISKNLIEFKTAVEQMI
jgi:hypothetical protein